MFILKGQHLLYCFQNNFNKQSGSGPILIQAPAGGYFTSSKVARKFIFILQTQKQVLLPGV
ncbi:MAG: hypothetical protein NZ519_09700 [Bacteroidia bacterium]|nr:hypothetical protein [Bacteroidia bacterium]